MWVQRGLGAVTWNVATLNYISWASARVAAGIVRLKFANPQQMCAHSDLVLLPETHGTDADVKQWELEIPD